jgi:hypothetical protein
MIYRRANHAEIAKNCLRWAEFMLGEWNLDAFEFEK